MPAIPGANTHGTSCAGIIAMRRDNNICGVGVAYESNIGGITNIYVHTITFSLCLGIRFNLNSSSDLIESSALGFRNSYIDIYSNSWGPIDSGYTVDGPGELLTTTFENGIRNVSIIYY